MLETTYNPADIEARVAAAWDQANAFACGRSERAGAKPYCIVIPPPNVTGSLHMGHALNNALQDILVRYHRMKGDDVLWQPGTDHAGIATQMVVERQLAERQQPDRRAMGRDKFLETVWKWKAESGGTIVNQLKRLGASCDWSRERFTMGKDGSPNEPMVRAVMKVFVDLYNTVLPDGTRLIYKDKRLVNWDPKFQTAISDLEVEQIEKKGTFKWVRFSQGAPGQAPTLGEIDKDGKPVTLDHVKLGKLLDREPAGHMYYFNYPLDGVAYDPDNADTFITVATTRPETMLGDTAVAVHPEHPRYKSWIGRVLVLPLTERKIPIVGDEYADPEKGTGAVKITPAHDFNDFEVGKRHASKLVPPINILDAFGKLNENVPEAYRGMDRFEARKRVVADLDALGLVGKIEPTTQQVPHGDRSGVAIEPWLTDQWYVNAGELAKPALAAVRGGQTRFVPERFAADYFRWLDNIQPWCISRQLWWGHQIPAWYGYRIGSDGNLVVSSTEPAEQPFSFVCSTESEAVELARKAYNSEDIVVVDNANRALEDVYGPQRGKGRKQYAIWRDPDVLDTWFSSALWPFSTLGWPEDTKEVERFYPTSVLVTGFDIIFFWVARMMMMGTHFMKDAGGKPQVPFADVYIHGLVRDEKGQKMSKSKGNVVDPLVMIDQFGADALRFSMAAMASQGSDVKFSVKRIEGYRNFATKIWNATRFAEINGCVRDPAFDPRTAKHTVNRWIIGETERAAKSVTAAIEAYKFNEAATAIYEFVWGRVCDWYVELTKPVLAGDDAEVAAETRACTAWVLDQSMALLHPFMPFITEELWDKTAGTVPRKSLLVLADWPALDGLADPAADQEIGQLIALISEVRSVRTEMNVPAGAKVRLLVTSGGKPVADRIARHADTLKRLARLETIENGGDAPKGSAMIVVGDLTAAIPLEGVIDMDAERARLAKTIGAHESDIAKMVAKLTNADFMARAKPEAIEESRERKAELDGLVAKLKVALARIEG